MNAKLKITEVRTQAFYNAVVSLPLSVKHRDDFSNHGANRLDLEETLTKTSSSEVRKAESKPHVFRAFYTTKLRMSVPDIVLNLPQNTVEI